MIASVPAAVAAPIPAPVAAPVTAAPVRATSAAATTSAPATAVSFAPMMFQPAPATSNMLGSLNPDLRGWQLTAAAQPGSTQPTGASNLIPRVTLTDLSHSSMIQPQVTAPQMSSAPPQINVDSSDSSEDEGRQIYNVTQSVPSYAYVNPMFINQQGPNISHVPSKLQRKIQLNQYVELGKLFRPDNPYEKESVFTIQRNGSLKIVSQPKTNDIYTFSRFIDCFIVYMAIRGKSHPQEYPGMIKYVETIKGLFAQQCDGILYDRRFRMMRADNPNVPWSCYMAELVVRKPQQIPYEFNNANSQSNQNQQIITAPKQPGKLFCHFYNSGKCSRTSCRYPHVCGICFDKNHTKRTCPKKTNN